METRANYVIVGTFVLICIIGLFVAVLWVAGSQFREEYTYYRTYFTGDQANYRALLDYYTAAQENEHVSADALLIAAAIRVGLAEQAVELSRMRAFGVGQYAGAKGPMT